MEITYELQDPIEFEGKTSGALLKCVESISLRSPTARVFVDLERRNLLADEHELEMGFELVRVCGKLDAPTADRLSVRDLKGAMEAMEKAGFFGSPSAPKPTQSEPNEDR